MPEGIINGVTTGILATLIGCIPYYYRRDRLTRLFAASNLWLAVWNLNDLVQFMPINPAAKVMVYRLGYVAGVILVWYFFNFILTFAGVDMKRFQRVLSSLKWICGAMSLLMMSPLIISGLNESVYPMDLPGSLYPLFIVFLLGTLGYALFQLFEAYQVSQGHARIQMKYMFVALFFALLEGPLFFYTVYTKHYSTLFYYFQVVYILIVSYAILAHRLMDIDVIIRKTAIYSVVTGALTAVYLLITTQLAKVLEGVGGQAGFWPAAVAAAAVALLFNPLLNRVRSLMDRRFFGDWLRDMSRGVVHEVKSPLASISLPAELTLMDLEDIERGKKKFQQLLPALKERMRVILKKTSEVAERIEALDELAGAQGAALVPVAMSGVIRNGISAAESALDQQALPLSVDIPEILAPVRGSAKQLELVFANLVKNAAEAMEEGTRGPIHITASEDPKWVVISVRDSGPGMTREAQEHLFDPNFTTKGARGHGLGLYLCHKIIREHGGTIEVASDPGKGTTFTVRLPKASS